MQYVEKLGVSCEPVHTGIQLNTRGSAHSHRFVWSKFVKALREVAGTVQFCTGPDDFDLDETTQRYVCEKLLLDSV